MSTVQAPLPSADFSDADADLILISTYKPARYGSWSPEQLVVEYRVYKNKLAASSTVFSDMIALGGEEAENPARHGLPVVHLEEGSRTLTTLLQLIYNDYTRQPDLDGVTYTEAFALWMSGKKYLMPTVQLIAEHILKTRYHTAGIHDFIELYVGAAVNGHNFGWTEATEKKLLRVSLVTLFEAGLSALPENDLVDFVCKHGRGTDFHLKRIKMYVQATAVYGSLRRQSPEQLQASQNCLIEIADIMEAIPML